MTTSEDVHEGVFGEGEVGKSKQSLVLLHETDRVRKIDGSGNITRFVQLPYVTWLCVKGGTVAFRGDIVRSDPEMRSYWLEAGKFSFVIFTLKTRVFELNSNINDDSLYKTRSGKKTFFFFQKSTKLILCIFDPYPLFRESFEPLLLYYPTSGKTN